MKEVTKEYAEKWISPLSFSEFAKGEYRNKGLIFSVAGISFVKNVEKKISYIKEGDTVLFEKVDDNEFDDNAVRIVIVANTPKGKRKIPMGWMPKKINKNYRSETSKGKTFFAEVFSVFDGDTDIKGKTKLNPGIKIEVFDFEEKERKSLDDFAEFIPDDENPPF